MARVTKLLMLLVAASTVIALVLVFHMTSGDNEQQVVRDDELRRIPVESTAPPSTLIKGYCNPPDKITIGAEGMSQSLWP